MNVNVDVEVLHHNEVGYNKEARVLWPVIENRKKV